MSGAGLAALTDIPDEHYAIVRSGLPGPAAVVVVTADADRRAAGICERAAEACAKQLSADRHAYTVVHVHGGGAVRRWDRHAEFCAGRLIWRREDSPNAVQEVVGGVPDGRGDWSLSDG